MPKGKRPLAACMCQSPKSPNHVFWSWMGSSLFKKNLTLKRNHKHLQTLFVLEPLIDKWENNVVYSTFSRFSPHLITETPTNMLFTC